MCVGFFRGPISVCSLFLDLKHYWILSWARPCLFVILGLGAFWILSWGQTLSVSFCVRVATLLDSFVGLTMSVCDFWIWDALLDSFVGQILSGTITSRRSNLLSTGNGHSVEWDCGMEWGIGLFIFRARLCLFVIFGFVFWVITSWARPYLFVIFGLGALLDSLVGPDLVCSCFGFGGIVGFFRGLDPVCSFFFGGGKGGGHCWILLWTILFGGQSPVDEPSFCRMGSVILSNGIVGLNLGI